MTSTRQGTFRTSKGKTFYVAPNGDNSNPGTIEKPLATLAGARDKVRAVLNDNDNGDITVYFRGGYYYFKETVVFGLEDSGTENQVVTYRNYPGETPVFSSGVHITGWRLIQADDPGYDQIPQVARPSVYIADVTKVLEKTGRFRFLLDRSEDWLPRAKTTPFKPTEGHHFGYEELVPPEQKKVMEYTPDNPIKSWPNIEDIEMRIRISPYTVNILPIERVDTKNHKLYTKVPATYLMKNLVEKICSIDFGPNVWIENTLAGLDETGEWVLNTQTKKLYLWPIPDFDDQVDEIYAPALIELIRVEGKIDYWGSRDIPVKYLRFKGITFTNGNRDSWSKGDAAVQHDWERIDKSTALLRFRGSEHCVVDGCTFIKSGGTGVRFDLHSQSNAVKNCYFDYLGMSGIFFCGYGCGTKDMNHHNEIINNEITRIGQDQWDSHGIILWNSGFNHVAYNYIHHCPRKAISLSSSRVNFFNPKTPTREFGWPVMRWREIDEKNYFRWEGSDWATRDYDACGKYRHLNGNSIEFNTVHDVLLWGNDGAAINITGAGNDDEHPNVFRFNCVYHVKTSILLRADGSVRKWVAKQNILFGSHLPFMVAPGCYTPVIQSNVFFDCGNPAKGYINAISHDPFGFGTTEFIKGNLIFDEPITDYESLVPFLDDYIVLYDILDRDVFPGHTVGVSMSMIKEKLGYLIEEIKRRRGKFVHQHAQKD